ncbi:hypothetical protein BG000_004934 [Podila horticola]|nr:hypothetical protein BG000_004934 [Podila horticola]
MEDSVNNSTLTTLPANEPEQLTVMEVKMIGTEVAALVCVWARQTVAEVPHITCAYTITNTLIIKSQPMNPDVARRLVNKGLNPTWTNVTITMILYHLPRVANNTLSFAIPKILNASAAAADYFTSLGSNFVLDWEGSMLYVAFDMVEILKGYEIPRWLFFSMKGVMVVCLFFLVATELLVDARHQLSLHMMVARELTAVKDGAKPLTVFQVQVRTSRPPYLRWVVSTLHADGLYVRLSKCSLLQEETELLGHIMKEGVHTGAGAAQVSKSLFNL